ncbi:MAG: GTP-binding protein [Nitrosomonas sp.]|nr:GTP-binding protein [Nitrosomonas sp.]
MEYSFKIIVVGDSTCGKSSIVGRLTDNEYVSNKQPTIGSDFKIRKFESKEKTLKIVFWDTAGQERYATLVATYYRDSHVILFVFDITSRNTFLSLDQRWLKHASWLPDADGSYEKLQEQTLSFLIGNKLDMSDKHRQVTKAEAAAFAASHGMSGYYEMSAATGELVFEQFQEIVDALALNVSHYEEDDDDSDGSRLLLTQQQPQNITIKRKNCCY